MLISHNKWRKADGKESTYCHKFNRICNFLWNDIELLKEFGYEVSFAANTEVITIVFLK